MVPNGWEHKSFKQILKLDRGSSPRPIVNFMTDSDDGVNWIKIGDTKGEAAFINSTKEKITREGAKKSRKVSKGEIILSNSMSYGKPYILNIDGFIHDGWFVIRNYEQNLERDYLIQLLGGELVQRQYKRLAAGGVVTNISSELVYFVKVDVPPLPEQRKIATILGTWDKAINTTERLIDNSKQQKKALMQQLLTGKKRLLDDSEEPFEAQWEEAKLSDIGKVSIGLVTTMTKHYVKDGVPLIRNSDIKPNIIKKAKMLRLCADFSSSYDSRKLKKGDVVTVHTGEVGVSAVIDDELDGCMGFATLNTRPNINKVNPEYLSWYFNSELFIYWCISMSTGDGRQNLNLKDFVKAKVHLPSLLEQEKIVAVLVNADNEIQLLEQQLADLKQEKKALMQQLLTGKRRVKIDEAEVA